MRIFAKGRKSFSKITRIPQRDKRLIIKKFSKTFSVKSLAIVIKKVIIENDVISVLYSKKIKNFDNHTPNALLNLVL